MIKSACTIKGFTILRDDSVSQGTLLNYAPNIQFTLTSPRHRYTIIWRFGPINLLVCSNSLVNDRSEVS
ncbi:hypothetical protein V1477_021123 [Vespula maculifrons]|uniref:Uncharacterized protein n=1 Tax=Vespula maculifrons TaxID=7453 RepID=A0ABD2AHV3_VESMC